MKTNIIICQLTFFLFILNIPAKSEVSADSLQRDEKASSHSLYFISGYGDNLIIGSSISKPQSFFYGSLAYGFKNEFFVSASSFFLPGFKQVPAYNVLGLSYSHVFNNWFDIAMSSSAFRAHSELTDTLFSSFVYGDLTLGIDWKLAYTKISFCRVFASGAKTSMMIRNSRYFQTGNFFSGKAYVSFDPYANILLGSLTKTTTSEGTTVIGVSSPVWSGGNGSGSGSSGGSGSGSGQGSGSGSGGSSGTTTTTTTYLTSDYFGMMEVDLGLPVGFNAGRFTLEAEPGYVVPLFNDASIPSPKGFTMMLSCYIRIL